GRFVREDLVGFHAEHYWPNRAAIVVAGDFDGADLARELDRLLAGWAGKARSQNEQATAEPPTSARILLIDRPGAPQAVVRVGHIGIARSDPDHDALMIFNQV